MQAIPADAPSQRGVPVSHARRKFIATASAAIAGAVVPKVFAGEKQPSTKKHIVTLSFEDGKDLIRRCLDVFAEKFEGFDTKQAIFNELQVTIWQSPKHPKTSTVTSLSFQLMFERY
jgi:hypothetical protein